MGLQRHESAEALLATAGHVLEAAPDVLLYGLAAQMVGRDVAEGTYLASLHAATGVAGAALRTPGRKLLLTPMAEDGCARVAEDVTEVVPSLEGVLAEQATARAFADVWCRRTGQRPRDGFAQRLLVLEALAPPVGVPGALRPAARAESHGLGAWVLAFLSEVELDEPRVPPERIAGRRIERGELFVWDHGGARAIAAVVGRSPKAARIGLVYTPPEWRGRGYASALVAALAERLRAEGCPTCSLFTMRDNPLTNRLYERLGFTHRADYQDVWWGSPA